MALPTTLWSFVLPKGLVTDAGDIVREGRMRLATGRDELAALRDPDVADADDPRLGLVVLSRVITSFGDRDGLSPDDLEGLFAADLAHLQELYRALNYGTQDEIDRMTTGPAPTVAPLGFTAAPVPPSVPTPSVPAAPPGPPVAAAPGTSESDDVPIDDVTADGGDVDPDAAVPEVTTPKPRGRRARIEEVGAARTGARS